jgi:hypothetical protein
MAGLAAGLRTVGAQMRVRATLLADAVSRERPAVSA